MELIFDLRLCVTYRKIKPLIVTVGVGVILDKKCVRVGLLPVFESAKQIAAFEFGVELEQRLPYTRVPVHALGQNRFTSLLNNLKRFYWLKLHFLS